MFYKQNKKLKRGLKSQFSKRNREFVIARRRRKVAGLYLRGTSATRIAELLDVSLNTIIKDLSSLQKAWIQNSERDFRLKKSEELAKIDAIEKEAWIRYKESCKFQTTNKKRIEKGVNSEGDFGVTKEVIDKTKKKLLGDPRYLDKISWCVEARMKLLGLVEEKETGNNVNIQFNWDKLYDPSEREYDPVEARIKGETKQIEDKNRVYLNHEDYVMKDLIKIEKECMRDNLTGELLVLDVVKEYMDKNYLEIQMNEIQVEIFD